MSAESVDLRCPPLSCRTSPLKGGDWRPRFANRRWAASGANLPPVGEMSGRTEGGAKARFRALVASASLLALALFASPASAARIDDQFRAWLETTSGPKPRPNGVSKRHLRRRLRRRDAEPQAARPRHAGRKGEDAEEAAPGRVRLARQLFRRKDHRRGHRRRPGARRQARQDACRDREAHTACRAASCSPSGAANPASARPRCPMTPSRCSAPRRSCRPARTCSARRCWPRWRWSNGASRRATPMKSSWAGALGQPQFLPTSFLEACRRFRRRRPRRHLELDADTLASIANYLVDYGWVKGRDWGFEVTVPDSVSCALEGPDQGKRISEWAAMGIARVSGKPFPASELRAEGFLLMPAGRNGPAFIVTPNFYVLKEYNESDLYALFIGHGADRIAGGDKTLCRQMGQGRRALPLRHRRACSARWRRRATMSAAPTACPASRRAARSATGRPRTAAPRPAFPTRNWSRRSSDRSAARVYKHLRHAIVGFEAI